VFGSERTGLTNEELEAAHALIPHTRPLRLPVTESRHGVQLVAYELFRAGDSDAAAHAPAGPPLAGAQEMARLYTHFAQVLEEIEFRDRTQSGTHLMGRIRRFLQRAELDPERSQHPARHPHRGTESAPPRRCAASMSAAAPLYLDYAATTPGRPGRGGGHERLSHGGRGLRQSLLGACLGALAAARIAQARAQVAALLGAAADEIVFTSGPPNPTT